MRAMQPCTGSPLLPHVAWLVHRAYNVEKLFEPEVSMQIAAVSILLSIIASATPSTTPSAVPSAEYDFARRFDPEIVMRAYEGHHFAESVSGNGRVLVLNGVGLRKSAAKVYIAALY